MNAYIKVKSTLSNNYNTFLIDTGADISLFKIGNISPDLKYDPYRNCQISGVGEGSTETIGRTKAELICEDIAFKHNFYLVANEFPIPCDGILGLDFIKSFNCILDFNEGKDFIVLRPFDFPENVAIPILSSPNKNSMTLPARCETLRKINIQFEEPALLVPYQQLQEGIFLAQTIITEQNPYVKVLNINFHNTYVENLQVKTESMNNYDIYQIDEREKDKSKIIMDKLSKNFPNFVKKELHELCKQYTDIFALESDKITCNNFYKQKFRMKDDAPVYIKNYRIPQSQREIIHQHIDKLVEDGIVEPSQSEFNSPVLLVPKKSLPDSKEKRWRLVIDYRRVNDKLIADKYPLPRIDDILDNLGKARFFSCIDLMSGFHQIELDKDSRDITSFSSDNGSYRFKRLPFGIKVAPNSFQRMMSLAFSGLTPDKCFIYMDNLVVIAPTEEKMFKHLTEVFEKCRKFNLKLHPDKCMFFRHEVTYLGHKCTDKGILPDDSKTDKILNFPKPQDADAVRRFVAFCNYYCRFIRNFAHHASHLTTLLKKNVNFE